MAGDGIDGVSVPDTGIVAALPDPGEVSPALPVRIASASTTDPVQNDVAAAALPGEAAEIERRHRFA